MKNHQNEERLADLYDLFRFTRLWGIQDGKFTRWEEWPGDEDAFNNSWI